MKMKILFKILMLAAVVGVGGCKKSWLDVNTNPNTLPTASPNFVFTNALYTTATNEVFQNETGSYFAAQWTQSNSYITSSTIFGYQFTNSDFNYFDPIYNNLEDYQYVIENADGAGQPFLKGPAKVMKAYLFQKLVDMYGDVPFSEALQGVKNLAPKFDDQKAIYEALIPMLDEAIANIKASPFTGAFVSSDITTAGSLANGNSTKWIRFANSLKLRILIRQSRVPGRDAYITTQIKKAVDEGTGFLGAGQDFGVNPGFVASSGKMNPFYERFGYNAAGTIQSYARYPRPTSYLFDLLKAANDTFRLKRMAYARNGENPNSPGKSKEVENIANYVGVPYGIGSGYTAQASSYIGPAVITRGEFNKPLYLMIAAESQLLLAEAAFRYGAAAGLTATAQSYYEQGVRESFRILGVPDATNAATTLLTSGIDESDWAATTNKLQAIWKQKWLALVNYEGVEAWAEVRRTNYPPIPKSATASASAKPPLRFYYPSSESGSNKNVPSGIDPFNTRLFWDVD
jgi:hypothetical protein